jgi:hypothetical protein
MAVPNTDYTEIITTTLDNYRDTLADNVMKGIPLFQRLNEKGNVDPVDGGVKILENLMYGESIVQWYNGFETLSLEQSDVLTSAAFDWKQMNANVVVSGLEEIINSGRAAVHKLVKSRIQVAEISMKNEMGRAVYFSNTENGGKSIGGLQHLVSDLPTSGIVGGIDTASNLWWANQYYDFSDVSITPSSTTIQHAMNKTFLRCGDGTSDTPDLIMAGEDFFNFYEESLQPQQRFTDAKKASGGFNGYAYKTADVLPDLRCAATRMYFLNTDYLHLRPGSNRNFVTLDRKSATNQDAYVVPMYWAGNITCSHRGRQGVLVA